MTPHKDTQRFLDLLSFWHTLEFFVPFDLESAENFYSKSLWYGQKLLDNPLPWENDTALAKIGGNPERLYAYRLFMGVFNKSDVAEALSKLEGWEPYRDDELVPDLSCTIKISVDHKGIPSFAPIEVSTLPWALGQLQAGRDLSTELFAKFKNDLLAAFSDLETAIADREDPKLSWPDIDKIEEIIARASDFYPKEGFRSWLCCFLDMGKRKEAIEEPEKDTEVAPFPNSEFPDEASEVASGENEDTGTVRSKREKRRREIRILNSFFLEDLERAKEAVQKRNLSQPLAAYLRNAPHNERISVGSEQGHEALSTSLAPLMYPLGRWPTDPNIHQSLMQQFALNRIGQDLGKDSGIFAIHGPPGTGKTTLLRDLVATIIVERARKLFSLRRASDAITGFINRDMTDGAAISSIHPSLTGYEILVCSSNNGAVENISRELPAKSSIASKFSDTARYLTPVAKRLFCSRDKRSIDPWGLISGVLGNKRNREEFIGRVFFSPFGESPEEKAIRREKPELNLREFTDSYSGASFNEAKKVFKSCLSRVVELQKYIHAHIGRTDSAPEALLNMRLVLPADPESMEGQRNAWWSSGELNEAQSKLFLAALQLHEAFIVEAMEHGAFRMNVRHLQKLLRGNVFVNEKALIALWQTLFLIVPVISSTFASVERMFRNIHSSFLGWLIIDEAGQAPVHTCVGGLLRSKRAIVLGDPLQLEPIYTVPTNVIRWAATTKLSDSLREDKYPFPHLQSVQASADAVVKYGFEQPCGEETLWVGSPLRIHRRCAEPMFTISNEIAYGNHMFLGRSPKPSISLKSKWIHVVGPSSNRHWVKKQGDILLCCLREELEAYGPLPRSFVITPFRAVREELRHLLRNKDILSSLYIEGCGISFNEWISEFKAWITRSVGTIHTFQGKEADIVYLVLGLDKTQRGAGIWASSKPNLLNVAVTRARETLVVIGDKDFWGELGVFRVLQEVMEK